MFATQLKKLRTNKGISQLALAEMLGISQQAIGKWETGKATPDYDNLKRLANYFNVTTDFLLGENSKVNTEPRYYHDSKVAEMANELKDNPDMRILFDASRKLSKKDIEAVIHIVKSMSGDE